MENFSLEKRVDFLNSLKNKTDQQQLLLQLAAKIRSGAELSVQEKNAFKILAAVEKTAWRARQAERAARGVFKVQGEEKRKKETHAKICLGVAAINIAKTNSEFRGALLCGLQSITNVDMQSVEQLIGVEHVSTQV